MQKLNIFHFSAYNRTGTTLPIVFVHILPDEEVECPDPGSITHGVKDPPNETFFCGDEVTYVCDIGYELRGESLAQCTATGQFSQQPPECVIAGEYFFLLILCCE